MMLRFGYGFVLLHGLRVCCLLFDVLGYVLRLGFALCFGLRDLVVCLGRGDVFVFVLLRL